MNRFQESLRIIPRPVKVIALVVYIGLASFFRFFLIPHDQGLRTSPAIGQWAFSLLLPLFLAALVLFWGFVYADAKRRQMRYVMWTLLAIFVPNAIGVILYFLLRDPLPQECPNCHGVARGSFAYCPKCGTILAPACPQCRKPVELGWTNCAWCGLKLEGKFAPASWLNRKLQK